MMPTLPPRICGCGRAVPSGERCACQVIRDRERKARFDRTRPTARQRGYDADWQKARAEYLAINPYCRCCGGHAVVVDHVKPHRGDRRLFWDKRNWQPLCVRCHSSMKQRQERQS